MTEDEKRLETARSEFEASKQSGGCYCGHLQYTIDSALAPVVNCHCSFCRRLHGASFATIGFFPADRFAWATGSGAPARFTTPMGNDRYFCGRCASPIYNHAPAAGLACVVVASLDAGTAPAPWVHVNTESMDPAFAIADALPRFPSWPGPDELRQMARDRGASLPAELFAAGA